MMTQKQTMTLRWFTKILCVCTAFLIFAGGMVTSTGSGLSVPDWPLSYGMIFPPMIGGIFYEHGHRMIAAFVGFCTLVLAVLLWRWEKRAWVKKLGLLALGAVILQGVLGGITVLFYLPLAVSVSHAVLAQSFFTITIILAYSQSLERFTRENSSPKVFSPGFIRWAVILFVCIFIQLVLGALMRHTKSGLAIPDFPTTGGMLWPVFDESFLVRINRWRFEVNLPYVTMHQVLIHFAHRLWAMTVAIAGVAIMINSYRAYRSRKEIIQLANSLVILMATQILLGVMTVLTEKIPAIASLHVATGAILLGMSAVLLLRVFPLDLKSFAKTFKPLPGSIHV